MTEIELEIDITKKSYLDDTIKEFWTKKNNPGYEFFKEKISALLLSLSKGDYIEFLAYINGSYGRDILVDFQTSYFKILDKHGIVDEQGNSKIMVKIQPVIK